MSYRKQKKLSLLPTRSDGLASFLLISFHRCCPLSFGEAHFCRRRRSQKAITSDQRGFAGVQPPHNALTSRQRLLVGVELVMRVLSFGWSRPRRCWDATDLILLFFCCRLRNQKQSSTNFDVHIFSQSLSYFDEEV